MLSQFFAPDCALKYQLCDTVSGQTKTFGAICSVVSPHESVLNREFSHTIQNCRPKACLGSLPFRTSQGA